MPMSDEKVQSWLNAAKLSFNPELYRRATMFQRCCVLWQAIGDCDIPADFEHHAMAADFEADMKKFAEPRPSSAVLKRLLGGWKQTFERIGSSSASQGDHILPLEANLDNSSAMEIDEEGFGGNGGGASEKDNVPSRRDFVDDNDLYPRTIRALVDGSEQLQENSLSRPSKRRLEEVSLAALDQSGQPDVLQEDVTRSTTQFPSKPWEDIESSDDFKNLRSAIIQLLETLVDEGQDYWPRFRPDNDLWKETDPTIKSHVSSLNLPEVPLRAHPSLPDLLLYGLGEAGVVDAQLNTRTEQIIKTGLDCYFVNAGGVGKTRMLFECLSRLWGIFFNCHHDVGRNPYGSRDISTAKQILSESRMPSSGRLVNFQGYVSSTDPNANAIRLSNDAMAQRVYRTLFFARMLVFDWFLTAWTSRKACDPNSDAIKLWCMLQIRPQLGQISDVFDSVFYAIIDIDSQSVLHALRSIQPKWNIQFDLLIFDEVHLPATEFASAFPASNSAEARPLLKPLIATMRDLAPLARVFVAATYFNEDLIKEAIGSTLLKNDRTPPTTFSDFGDSNNMTTIVSVMSHFLTAEYVRRIPPADLAEIAFWLPGRHRFLSNFIQWVLQQGAGPQCLKNVLRRLVKGSTGTLWAGTPTDISGFSRMGLIPAPLKAKTLTQDLVSVHQDICQTVVCFVINGQTPCWPIGKLKHVTLGIGRVVTAADGRTYVTIDEHLVLAALMHWLDQNHEQFVSGLDRSMADVRESTRGLAYEDVYTYLIWNAFVDEGRPLNEAFEFIYLEPSWASETAQLVDVFKSHSPDNRTHTLERTATTQIGLKTRTAEETREWFAGRKARIPLLQPDEYFGPDLANGLLLPGGQEVLFLHQLKYWNSHKTSDKFREAVYKLSPEGLYKSCRNEFTALKTHLDHFKATPVLPMPPPHANKSTHKTYKYSKSPPEYTLIRVFGAFKGTYNLPKMDQSLGRYPIAVPAPGLISDGLLRFPAFTRAVENAARVESEMKNKKKKT